MLNEVFLQGVRAGDFRISSHKHKEIVLSFRLDVRRQSGGKDSITCVIEDSELQRKCESISADAEISIAGRIQTRFFRVGPTLASATEVLIQDLVVV